MIFILYERKERDKGNPSLLVASIIQVSSSPKSEKNSLLYFDVDFN